MLYLLDKISKLKKQKTLVLFALADTIQTLIFISYYFRDSKKYVSLYNPGLTVGHRVDYFRGLSFVMMRFSGNPGYVNAPDKKADKVSLALRWLMVNAGGDVIVSDGNVMRVLMIIYWDYQTLFLVIQSFISDYTDLRKDKRMFCTCEVGSKEKYKSVVINNFSATTHRF